MYRARYPLALGVAATSLAVYSAWHRRPTTLATATTSPLPLTIVHAESRVSPSPLHAPLPAIPSREEQLARLKSGEEFDVLVIGGGATGAGVALDAVCRGLSVALVERDDFASGTSSRSTKLVHGGVRYLEKAFRQLDYEQYKLVREALHERAVFLNIAPHLSSQLPIMLPIYQWWQVPYYWIGAKVYDLLAGDENLEKSYFLSKTKALERFPMLKRDSLVGAVVYYDGQHNDARMNVTLAMTAANQGACVVNHCGVTQLLHQPVDDDVRRAATRPSGEPTTALPPSTGGDTVRITRETPLPRDRSLPTTVVCGGQMQDMLTGEVFTVRAKSVINATGPFTDALRVLDNVDTTPIVCPSSGVHIVLPNYYSPRDMGLIDPSTSDGRVIFFLPWQNHTIAGTTDSVTSVTSLPKPREEEIQFILREVSHYLSPDIQVRRGDVLAAWSGIRPLVRDPHATNTQELVRNHMVLVSDQHLITIAGGKWTTYRQMAEDAVDTAIQVCHLTPTHPSTTRELKLLGGTAFHPLMFVSLVQMYGLDREVAEHLTYSYGDLAFRVAEYARPTGQRWPVLGQRLHPGFPYLEEEVLYVIDHEYARTIVDVMARRTRMAFLNSQAALESLPRVADLMGKKLNWSKSQLAQEIADAKTFLLTMGLDEVEKSFEFNALELVQYRQHFAALDTNRDGSVDVNDVLTFLKERRQETHMTEAQCHSLLANFDRNKNGTLEFNEFLELMSALKHGKRDESPLYGLYVDVSRPAISTERSGGGV